MSSARPQREFLKAANRGQRRGHRPGGSLAPSREQDSCRREQPGVVLSGAMARRVIWLARRISRRRRNGAGSARAAVFAALTAGGVDAERAGATPPPEPLRGPGSDPGGGSLLPAPPGTTYRRETGDEPRDSRCRSGAHGAPEPHVHLADEEDRMPAIKPRTTQKHFVRQVTRLYRENNETLFVRRVDRESWAFCPALEARPQVAVRSCAAVPRPSRPVHEIGTHNVLRYA